MKRSYSFWWLGALLALLLGVGFLQKAQQADSYFIPQARYDDAKPLGGKGLRLLLEKSGYRVQRQEKSLQKMPQDARIWLSLDFSSKYSEDEAKVLLDWVKQGGTLIWANAYDPINFISGWSSEEEGREYLREQLHLEPTQISEDFWDRNEMIYPAMQSFAAPSGDYGIGVHNASISPNTFSISKGNYRVLIGDKKNIKLAIIPQGKGQIIAAADAMIFTNRGLSRGDTAVFVSNLIRKNAPTGTGIYFDERSGTHLVKEAPHTLSYYLWQPPFRWALFQLAFMGLLLWVFYGRRAGKPVPIPVQSPVTRSSQFAEAMAGLYQKARRPEVPLQILREEFRRDLVRYCHASPLDDNAKLATRCSQMTNIPQQQLEQLLNRLEKPPKSDATALQIVQEMEQIRRKIETI